MTTSGKKSLGRQKVTMARMSKDSNRQVTFSKRRLGLFKKASELSTLCGAEAAVVVFSPGMKTFSYGHPSVEEIVDRFLLTNPPSDPNKTVEEAEDDVYVRDLSVHLTALNAQMEIERKRGEELTEVRKSKEEEYWWNKRPIEEYKLEELEKIKGTLEELRSIVPTDNVGGPVFHTDSNPMPGFDPNSGSY